MLCFLYTEFQHIYWGLFQEFLFCVTDMPASYQLWFQIIWIIRVSIFQEASTSSVLLFQELPGFIHSRIFPPSDEHRNYFKFWKIFIWCYSWFYRLIFFLFEFYYLLTICICIFIYLCLFFIAFIESYTLIANLYLLLLLWLECLIFNLVYSDYY